MTKTQIVAFAIVPIFFLGSTASADDHAQLESMKTAVDTCLPVKPLPSILSLDDAKMLVKADASPLWCNLVNNLGYLWHTPKSTVKLSSNMERAMIYSRRTAVIVTDRCLQNNVRLNFSLKNRVLAYVNYQHKCENNGDMKACDMARKVVLDMLYGGLGKDARNMMVRLRRIRQKGNKACSKKEEMAQYCKSISLNATVCENL